MEQERRRGAVIVEKPKYCKKWLLSLDTNNFKVRL